MKKAKRTWTGFFLLLFLMFELGDRFEKPRK